MLPNDVELKYIAVKFNFVLNNSRLLHRTKDRQIFVEKDKYMCKYSKRTNNISPFATIWTDTLIRVVVVEVVVVVNGGCHADLADHNGWSV